MSGGPLTIAANFLHAPRELTGTGYYALHLARALLRLPQQARIVAFCTAENVESFAIPEAPPERYRRIVWGRSRGNLMLRRAEEWLGLHRAVRRLPAEWRPDVFFGPSNFLPPFSPGVPCVVAIHDMTFHRHPKILPPVKRAYWHAWTWRTARAADAVLTVSESAKADIVHYLGLPSDRITVTLNGVAERFRIGEDEAGRPTRQAALRAAFPTLPGRYISFVGTLAPHKNVPLLIEALAQARRKPGCGEMALALAGKRGAGYDAIAQAIGRHGLGKAVLELGYMSDAHLPAFMEGAAAHVLPSIAEGFGLPIAEAMACGTPVVTASRGATAEVGGEAAVLADPEDAGAWAEALARMWTDPEERTRRRGACLARSRCFSWEEAAVRTLEVFERVKLKADL
ncbi:MAG: glycosyltransferase family 1 protein [Sumerlaeia bacterium]